MLITIIKLHSRMNTAAFLLPFLLLLASPATSPAGAQPSPPNQYPYARFSPSMAIIIVVLIAALFFMGFFSIYIRHCSESSIGAGSVRRALSLRSRRAAAARGLDASVIESFPTFSYAEVKDHQIGKGSLECAVCLNEFEDDETLRLLPQCDHVFHPECIDAWLGSHVTCPVCRANLSPSPPADDQLPESSPLPETDPAASGEVVVQVDEDQHQSESQPPPAAAGRSWSIRIPKVAVFGGAEKFRSHSTGHSMVYPVENLERFTLRLPDQVRKDVMNRASLNRTASLAAAAASLPRQGSSSRARFYRRIEREGRSSDRWGFSMRAMSMRSPKAAVEGGGGESGSGRIPVKMPSFKCLEPKASDDEAEFSPAISRRATRFEGQ